MLIGKGRYLAGQELDMLQFTKRPDSFGKGLDFKFGNCLWKRPTFLLLAPGSTLEKFAAIVNPENKPTKVNWTLSWPSALEMCGKTVL